MIDFDLSCPTCAGAATTGIRIDDPVGDYAKYINIYHNEEDNSNPGNALMAPLLNNLYDIFIDDQGFTQTPVTGPTYGVTNFWSPVGGTSPYNTLVNTIYSHYTFTYDYFSATSPSALTVSPMVMLPGSASTSQINGTDYCMNAGVVMPSSPEKRTDVNNNVLDGNSLFSAQGIFGNTPQNMSLEIVPNPFANNAEIRYAIPQNYGNATLDIIDGLGRSIECINLDASQNELTLNAAGLKPGLYYYTATAQNGNKLTGKFIIVNP